MVKKQTKQNSRSLKTEIKIRGSELTIKACESYQTAKKRIMDNQNFIEITSQGNKKIIINKEQIAGCQLI